MRKLQRDDIPEEIKKKIFFSICDAQLFAKLKENNELFESIKASGIEVVYSKLFEAVINRKNFITLSEGEIEIMRSVVAEMSKIIGVEFDGLELDEIEQNSGVVPLEDFSDTLGALNIAIAVVYDAAKCRCVNPWSIVHDEEDLEVLAEFIVRFYDL